jgi:DHA1 family tetracycline resistance protein-like MFS transporter
VIPRRPLVAAQHHRDGEPPRRAIRPLYAAGFVTAFGAHGVAANLGSDLHLGPGTLPSLLILGALLAIYDGAEVVLKPILGALSDRVGPRPVLLGGLVAFAACSAAFVLATTPVWLGLARLGQGAAAAAFSPAAATLIARLAPAHRSGRAFGGYGAYKSLGYAGGPLLGSALVTLGGFTALFATLAVLAAAVATWAALIVPRVAPLPRTRQTVLDLARRLGSRGFLAPTTGLAATTAALAAGVGFLPVLGAHAGLHPIQAGAVVSLLALATAAAQPWAGRARDTTHLPDTIGMALGLLTAAAGLTLTALTTSLPTLLASALLTGAGIGLATPLGFAALAANTPPDRLGQTMGCAEIGRELGDAGGPLLVGATATALTLPSGLLILATTLIACAAAIALTRLPATPRGRYSDRPTS